MIRQKIIRKNYKEKGKIIREYAKVNMPFDNMPFDNMVSKKRIKRGYKMSMNYKEFVL